MSDDQRVGEDYSMKEQLEERRENGSKSEEKSDDHIFHPSIQTTLIIDCLRY